MSLDSENENEGHSTLEPDNENGPEEIEGRRRRKSESPFIDLWADGSEEEKEDDEDDEDDKKYCFYRLKRLTEQLDNAVRLYPEKLWSVKVFRLSWKWRERSSVKIAERTYEERAQALHC